MNHLKDKFLLAVINNDIFNMDIIHSLGFPINYDNDIALITASSYGKLISVMWLLNHIDSNVDINAQDGRPLISATKMKHYNVIFFLLEKGANINIQGCSSLIIACLNGYSDIVKLLLEYNVNYKIDNYYPLVIAATFGRESIVKMLLDAGSDPYTRNFEAINNANNNGHYNTVKILITHELIKKVNKTFL